jgi:hypothetical protein
MDTKNIGKWSYLVGLVLVIVTALIGFSASWLSLLLVIFAVLTGLFLADADELTNYGVRYLSLAVVAASLDSFPVLGSFVTTIAGAMLGFFGPILLTVLLVFNYKQAVAWAKG